MNDRMKGFPLLYLSSLLFAVSAVAVKEASRYYNSFLVSGIRFLIGAVFCVFILILSAGEVKAVSRKIVFLRGLFGFAAMGLYYFSISHQGRD